MDDFGGGMAAFAHLQHTAWLLYLWFGPLAFAAFGFWLGRP